MEEQLAAAPSGDSGIGAEVTCQAAGSSLLLSAATRDSRSAGGGRRAGPGGWTGRCPFSAAAGGGPSEQGDRPSPAPPPGTPADQGSPATSDRRGFDTPPPGQAAGCPPGVPSRRGWGVQGGAREGRARVTPGRQGAPLGLPGSAPGTCWEALCCPQGPMRPEREAETLLPSPGCLRDRLAGGSHPPLLASRGQVWFPHRKACLTASR